MAAAVIDLYCERTAPGLLNEPLNALSNLGFLCAAALAWRAAAARGGDVRLLAALLAAIGIGSGLFHTWATAWAQWLDVLPILVFQLAFLALYLARVAQLPPAPVAAVVGTFLLVVVGAAQARAALNGSLGYLPALLVLGWLGHHAWRTAREPRIAAASGLFLLALTARSVDNALCAAWPHGTHFAWHLLNAAVLYLAITGYAAQRARVAPA
ncbi:MAG: ceramidase domain-containing protein [Gammaproteobacteria bacterium]